MYKGFWLLSGLFLSFVSSADELHTNAFGDVFNGSTPFSVGHVDTSIEGRFGAMLSVTFSLRAVLLQ